MSWIDDKRQMWLLRRWEKDPACDYCKQATRMCLPDEAGIAPNDMATADHYVPLSKGGPDHPSNWRLACFRCNNEKGNQWPEVWLGLVEGSWEPEQPVEAPSALAQALNQAGLKATISLECRL